MSQTVDWLSQVRFVVKQASNPLRDVASGKNYGVMLPSNQAIFSVRLDQTQLFYINAFHTLKSLPSVTFAAGIQAILLVLLKPSEQCSSEEKRIRADIERIMGIILFIVKQGTEYLIASGCDDPILPSIDPASLKTINTSVTVEALVKHMIATDSTVADVTASFASEINAKEDFIIKMKTDANKLNDNLLLLETKCKDLEREQGRLRDEKNKLHAEVEEIREKLVDQDATKLRLEKRVKELIADNEADREVLREAHRDLAVLDQERDQLRETMRLATDKLQGVIEAEKLSHEAEIRALSEKLRLSEQAARVSADKVRENQRVIEELIVERDRLENETLQLRVDREELRSKLTAVDKLKIGIEEEVVKLTGDLQKLQRDKDSLLQSDAERERSDDRIRELELQLMERNNDRRDNERLKIELRNAESRLRMREDEVETIRSRIDSSRKMEELLAEKGQLEAENIKLRESLRTEKRLVEELAKDVTERDRTNYRDQPMAQLKDGPDRLRPKEKSRL